MIVWLTGGSSGLGFYTALALREAGHTVIAGARSLPQREVLGIHQLPLDVTRQESVDGFVKAALTIAPRVDAVIHCAAVLHLGSCENVTPEQYAQVMETDFLGVVRMNQAVLPLMRENGGGKIVIYSSINGCLGVPFQSAYTAAKHALEGYAECLQMETRQFGIQVCLIEPGDHRGGSQRTRLHAEGESASPYAPSYESAVSVIARDEAHGSDPMRLGRKVAALLSRRRLPMRKCIASVDQHFVLWLHRLLPYGVTETLLKWYYLRSAKATQAEKKDHAAL